MRFGLKLENKKEYFNGAYKKFVDLIGVENTKLVFEEFKGTGNMELVLDRKLSEKRVFPAIDILRSGTRREDLLYKPEEQEAMDIMRKAFNGLKPEEAVDNILNMFAHTKTNEEFVQTVKKTRFL